MENTIIAHEVVHNVRRHKGRNKMMIVKIDLQKAYGQLEWDSLPLFYVCGDFPKRLLG